MAVLTKALTRLRSDFNVRFPGRDETSDGWIGNEAHQEYKSGHNPDESGNAEYEDSDSKDEVRAIDVDDDLRDSGGITMQQVADRIIATPRDIKRLKYMIYNRRIASRSNGWRWETYTGSNPHDKHLHVSGDPAYDEDGAEFTSVTQIGDEMDQGQFNDLMDGWLKRIATAKDDTTDTKALHSRNYARAIGWQYQDAGQPSAHNIMVATSGVLRKDLPEAVAAVKADTAGIIAAMQTPVPVNVDAEQVADALAADEEFKASIAKATAEELHRRSAD